MRIAPAFESDQATAPHDLVWIPGGTFLMGSDHHYPEEAPAHPVTVDGFWIDRTQVTNSAKQLAWRIVSMHSRGGRPTGSQSSAAVKRLRIWWLASMTNSSRSLRSLSFLGSCLGLRIKQYRKSDLSLWRF